ncbi:WAS/WASL-interacting protein family member 2-like [Centruroides sculpturatus]|uniref:WAS/WASL-interacting protein family member 2-like n=1 Tax=Centruroides sculpturatus TaxID=218467 RepID=UPI000C6D2D1A|nr:WAS/WASL-interacting protein family member 2-like [Centruroides sculpturatus]
MPPPPPPPPPPPAPPLPATSVDTSRPEKTGADRSALLQEIRLGTRLKKAVTNDKSGPIIGNQSSGGGVSAKGSRQPTMQLGNLFSEGVPKLRHVGHKFGANTETGSSSDAEPDKIHFTCANSYVSSPVSAHKSTREAASSAVTKSTNYAPRITKRSPFPNDVITKGPAPPPPSANYKPIFETNLSVNKLGPPLPNKPPGITRSSSHCYAAGRGARISRSPPSVKPPPPPKSPILALNEPPALPSKPPSLVRRLSYGAHDNRNGGFLHNNSDSRLNSYKNFCISSHQTNVQVSPTRVQSFSANKPNSSPAPPSRTGCVSSKPPNVKPPPPPPPPPPPNRTGVGPSPPTSAPPPPPHHYRINFSQNKPSLIYPNSSVSHVLPPPPPPSPPPPTRTSSVKSTYAPGRPIIGNFESKFKDKFHAFQELTPPDIFTSRPKLYPSKEAQSHRRQPAPPPPGMPNGTTSQPKIHIQLDSRLFANNIAEC